MVTKANTSAPYAARATNWWTRIRPDTLRVRLALLAALLLCLIQLVLSAAFYSFTSSWLLSQVDQNLLATAAQVAAALQADHERLERDDLRFDQAGAAASAILDRQQFFIRAIDLDTGKVLSESAVYGLVVTAPARSGAAGFETLASAVQNGLPMRVYTLPLADSASFALQVGRSLDEPLQTLAQILRLLLLMFIATAILAAASGWFLAQRALRPVSAITRTAQSIGEKDLSRRIALSLPDDELGRLAQTFNHMLDRIETAFVRQRQFTADAAHELRTPLSIMQTGLDVTLAQPRSADAYRVALENMHEEVLRLSELSSHLLALARADAGALHSKPRPTDLSLLLATVTQQIAAAAEQKQISLHRDLAARVIATVDQDRVIQLALNLLENAVKYTRPGSSITVRLWTAGDQVCFSVADTGVGIAPEHLPHVFERFYRADRARSRQQGGAGLGLAIAQEIAHLHGGEITVVSQPGVGSQFTVTLPQHGEQRESSEA